MTEGAAGPFGIPPARQPVPVDGIPAVRGKRVILSTPEGFVYDMRASSEVYVDPHGRSVVDVISEEDWYRWMLVNTAPEVACWRSVLVWAE